MKIVELDPSTPEWLDWRKHGVGASDIGVLMGDNPYRTPYQLWEDKCGYAKPIPLSAPMKHGIATEPLAREWVSANLNLRLEPICCEDEENSIFKASLDGWDAQRKVVVEIKCPTTETTIDAAREGGSIHKHWYDQMQWQMMICEAEKAYFAIWDYRSNGCIILEQWPDKKLWEEMREKATEFWTRVVCGDAPALTKGDYKEVENDALYAFLKEYEELDRAEKEAKAAKTKLRDVIYSYGEGDNFKAYGFSVCSTQGRVSYDYKAMKEDGIDIEKYATRGAGSFKINVPRGKK